MKLKLKLATLALGLGLMIGTAPQKADAAVLTTTVGITYYGQNVCDWDTFNGMCGTFNNTLGMADTSQSCEPYSWAILYEMMQGFLQYIANLFGFSVQVDCGWN